MARRNTFALAALLLLTGSGACNCIGEKPLALPVSVQVVDDQTGQNIAGGATLTVTRGSYTQSVTGTGFDAALAAGDRAGVYTVEVSKSGYQTWTKQNVNVEDKGLLCGKIQPVLLTARLVRTP
jgi:hypothetical protein